MLKCFLSAQRFRALCLSVCVSVCYYVQSTNVAMADSKRHIAIRVERILSIFLFYFFGRVSPVGPSNRLSKSCDKLNYFRSKKTGDSAAFIDWWWLSLCRSPWIVSIPSPKLIESWQISMQSRCTPTNHFNVIHKHTESLSSMHKHKQFFSHQISTQLSNKCNYPVLWRLTINDCRIDAKNKQNFHFISTTFRFAVVRLILHSLFPSEIPSGWCWFPFINDDIQQRTLYNGTMCSTIFTINKMFGFDMILCSL